MPTSNQLKAFQDEYQRGLEAAYSRMIATKGTAGGSEASIMDWLLDFARKDLRALGDSRWNYLSHEIVVFNRGYGQNRKTRTAHIAVTENWEPPTPDGLPRVLPSQHETKVLQQLIKRAIESLIHAEEARIPILAGELVIRRDTQEPQYLVDHPFPRFCYQTAQLLARFSNRIKVCEGCPIIFVGRSNQHYHNDNCRGLTGVRKSRNTPPERFFKRGRPRKVQPLLGSHIKGVPKPQKAQRKGVRHGTKRR